MSDTSPVAADQATPAEAQPAAGAAQAAAEKATSQKATSEQATPEQATPQQASAEQAEVRIRRAPKISVFLILGALVGFLGTLILTALQPVDPAIGFAALFGYFLIYGIPTGVVVGGIVGVIFEWASHRTAKIVPAERLVTEESETVEQPEQLEAAAARPELTDPPRELS